MCVECCTVRILTSSALQKNYKQVPISGDYIYDVRTRVLSKNEPTRGTSGCKPYKKCSIVEVIADTFRCFKLCSVLFLR